MSTATADPKTEKTTCEKISLKGVKTVAEALEAAKCTWIAEPHETMTDSGIFIPERFAYKAFVRSDTNTVIGQVGKKYKEIQNNAAFSFFDVLCEKYDAQYDFVNIINGGSKIVLSARIGTPLTIRKGDEVLTYINLINTFDGSTPLMAMSYFYRLVCTNGLMVPGKTSKAVIKHTGNIKNKTNEALRIMGISLEHIELFKTNSQILANKMLDAQKVDQFLREMLGVGDKFSTRKKNQADKIEELYTSGKGNGQGTAWDLYNGFVEWVDFHRSANEQTRMANAILGASNLKEKAFSVAMSL